MVLLLAVAILIWIIKSIIWWWTAVKLKYGLVIIKIKWWLMTITLLMLACFVLRWWAVVLFF